MLDYGMADRQGVVVQVSSGCGCGVWEAHPRCDRSQPPRR
jgi:hypothetical protein